MTKLFLKVLWFIFGIIFTIQAKINEDNFSEEYNVINSINPAWTDILSNNLKIKNISLFKESYLYVRNIKKDINLLLKIFDKVDNTFKNLIEINLERTKGTFDIHRNKRTASNYNRSECTISKDELIEMKTEMKNTIQLKHSHSLIESNCNFNFETTNCTELINLMKCSIQYLKNQFIEMTSNEVSSNEFTKWKTKYEKLNKVYLKLEDDLYRTNNQKYKIKIDNLNQELQHLKQVINKLEQDLNAASEKIIQITIELCSSEIHSKKMHNCVEKLNKLSNINYTDIIKKIIHRSFEYIIDDKDMIIISYIIDFINTFDIELKSKGYENIYEIMGTRKFLSTPYVLTFASKVQDYPNHELKMYVNNKIDEWSDKIINANYWEINAYADEQDFSFCYYLKDIITNTYANNIDNAKNIINFLDNLSTPNQKALGFYILYNDIILKHGINGEEIIMLIYKIKELIHDSKFNNLEESIKVNLQALILELPPWIKALLWDSVISIRSRFNNYKLISLHKYFAFIYIDTILAICPPTVFGADKWKITAQEKGAYFKINNIDSKHDYEYNWKIGAYNNGSDSYFVNENSGNKLHTKDTIGGWIGFWYAIPKDCYQVYEDYGDEDFQRWLIY